MDNHSDGNDGQTCIEYKQPTVSQYKRAMVEENEEGDSEARSVECYATTNSVGNCIHHHIIHFISSNYEHINHHHFLLLHCHRRRFLLHCLHRRFLPRHYRRLLRCHPNRRCYIPLLHILHQSHRTR